MILRSTLKHICCSFGNDTLHLLRNTNGVSLFHKTGLRNGPSGSVEKASALEERFVYPEFLPHPKAEWRNPIREKLERMDMLHRRANIAIPEFYVGSVLSVTSSNEHAPTKSTTFLGICIHIWEYGLRTKFLLRNIIDHQGVEVAFSLYDPKVQKIDVLRLEKRLDKDLFYLRDAEPEYSTFPLDMEPEYLPEGEPVPVNPIKVKMKPFPWRQRYEIKDYVGIQPFDHLMSWRRKRAITRVHKKPVEFDLMYQYRQTIPEEEQREIYAEVCSELQKYEIKRKQKIKRKTEFIPPTKTG